jgi:hypothetical protein
VGLWQIAGGAIAVLAWLDLLHRLDNASLGTDVLFALSFSIAFLSIGAGYGLVKARWGAIVPSLVVQVVQIIGFSLGDSGYQLTLGPYLDLTIIWTRGVSIAAGFQPRLTLWWGHASELPTGVAVNLLACFCIYTLLWFEPPVPTKAPLR